VSLRSYRDHAAREDEWFEQKHPEVVAEERRRARQVLRDLSEPRPAA
jgi:hypothetical protein